jgi:hypothetical protein|tara:strand:+ start:58 stop:699 length:642 start_codon:yes stop_codon:yes gene_type:complete
MKLLFNISIFVFSTCFIYAQNEDLALKYERATKLVDAKEALVIYQQIIDSNERSDYVWLSKLKKAEMLYAQGAYITSSKILKEFNLSAPDHLQTNSSKDLFLKSLNAAGQIDSLKAYKIILSSNSSSIKKPKSFQKNNSIWFIQFGAFTSKENAQLLKDSLIEDRIKNIQIEQVFKKGAMIYYVRSIHFKTYDKALRASKNLNGKIQFTISGF